MIQNNMEIYAALNEHYSITEKVHQGKKHLVVPVIMMKEGVHNGSHGAIYHPIDELGHFESAWNGIPVSIQHPSVDGKHVSANSPDIIDANVVGKVFNTHVEGDKLKAEAWLDKERLKQISPAVAEYLKKGQPIEVSLGMFTDDEAGEGTWNGETYTATARNHRPDHLALLPGGKGACSWKDGCGIRANEEGVSEMKRTKFNTNDTGGKKMTEENKGCCPEKVELLIQDENSKFTESDREWLLTQSEDVIEKLQPVIVEKEVIKEVIKEVSVNKEVSPTKEQVIQVLEESFSDPVKFLALLPDTIRDLMESGLKLHQDKRDWLVKHVMTNQATAVWAKEDLEQMSTNQLQKMADSIPAKMNYRAAGGNHVQANTDSNEVLLPFGVK